MRQPLTFVAGRRGLALEGIEKCAHAAEPVAVPGLNLPPETPDFGTGAARGNARPRTRLKQASLWALHSARPVLGPRGLFQIGAVWATTPTPAQVASFALAEMSDPCEEPTPGAADEVAVRAVEQAYDRAWCDGDLDGLMKCLTASAVLINPRGEVAAGEEEIRAVLGAFLAREADGSVHHSTVDRVSFLGDDVAIVDGQALISTLSEDGTQRPLFEHSFTDILIRDGGSWLIAHVRAYSFEPSP